MKKQELKINNDEPLYGYQFHPDLLYLDKLKLEEDKLIIKTLTDNKAI
jgi:hypothetical protein